MQFKAAGCSHEMGKWQSAAGAHATSEGVTAAVTSLSGEFTPAPFEGTRHFISFNMASRLVLNCGAGACADYCRVQC